MLIAVVILVCRFDFTGPGLLWEFSNNPCWSDRVVINFVRQVIVISITRNNEEHSQISGKGKECQ